MRAKSVRAFRALVTTAKKTPAVVQSLSAADLPDISQVKGEEGACSVHVKVKYSNVNYKDALVAQGLYAGLTLPMVGGIDLTGTVISDSSGKFKEGDKIIVNGFGIGTDHFGGFAEEAKVRPEWCQSLPAGMSHLTAARIGTAGYTASLCVEAIRQTVKPSEGPIAVSGATGGVGSVSVSLLSNLGYEVHAISGKTEQNAEFLTALGAHTVLNRSEFEVKPRALCKERFAGAVDACGSNVLANILSMTKRYGTVSACGLAAGLDLPTSVAPFILRGITLNGVECVYLPISKRESAYDLLSNACPESDLDLIGRNPIISLEEVPVVAKAMLSGEITGRYVVDPSA